jgi:hypothetical protein
MAATLIYERLSVGHQHSFGIDPPKTRSAGRGGLDEANDEELYFSVISLGEVLMGVTILPCGKRRDGIEEWLNETLHTG